MCAKKKKNLSFLRTLSNNAYALRMLWSVSPVYVTVYLASSLLYGGLDFLGGSYLLRGIVDGAEQGAPFTQILLYVILLGGISVTVSFLLDWYWNVPGEVAGNRFSARVEKELYRKAASMDLACYENPQYYDRYVRAFDRANNRIRNVLHSLDSLIFRIVTLSATSLLLFVIDPVLLLFGLLPLLLGLLRRVETKTKHRMSKELDPVNRKSSYVERTFYLSDYAKEMRVGSMHNALMRDLRSVYAEHRRIYRKYGFLRAFFSFIRYFGLEVVTVLGATLYSVWSALCVEGGMSVGDCIVVIGSIGTVSYNLNNLIQNLAEFNEHAVFLEDLRYFLNDTPSVRDGDYDPDPTGGDLCVENLSFRYEGSDCNALENISFCWKKGERIALVGSNGSGKSTLVKLLLRLYDPQEGTIAQNGRNLKELKAAEYRRTFSCVFQDFKLFSLSVTENVLLRPEGEGDRERVTEALRESGALDRVLQLEKGIDTVLTREFDEKGAVLSVGEQQKVLLARIFAEKRPYVILDEPSSALDPIAEYTMFENMIRATEGRSVLFVSHRLSSAVLADRVLLLDGGRIAEMGTHDELMAKNGKYAEMFRRQAENYLGEEGNNG